MISSLELARLCGVSQGTVDRAIHNRTGISEKTKQKVLVMAEKHGYMANPAALEIMGKGSGMVGVLSPALNSSMLMQMVQVVHDHIANYGYRTFLTPYHDYDQLVNGIREFAARKAAAVIVFPNNEKIQIPENLSKAIKVINLMEPMVNKNTFFVSPNNQKIAQICTQKLIDSGHKSLLMINYDAQRLTSYERKKGYESCVRSNNVIGHYLTDLQFDQLPSLVKRYGITGIYGHNDELAFKAIRTLEASGIFCPQDISIIGGQDTPQIKDMLPDISTFDYPIQSIAKVILAILQGKKHPHISPPSFRKGNTLKKI